ncbi:AAA family ATPase [Thermogladius sp.]|uniref:AAA family ATPase n=1 Tax=Thermogladius sp. TaxID=2023064 RepID=UPI003D0F5F61
MRILGVYLENIRSFRKGLIVFPLNGITVIQGEVGSGKTSILMSIAYAFETPAAGRVEYADAFATPQPRHLLRTGESRGVIRVLVRQGKRLFILERALQREGDRVVNSGNAIYAYELPEEGGPQVKPVLKLRLSSGDYIEKLRGLLGLVEKSGRQRPEVFTNIIYSPQFNLTSILELEPSKRREVIEIALGLSRYTDFRANVAKVIDTIGEKVRGVQLELSRLEDTLRSLDKQGLQSRVKKIEEEKARVRRELEKVVSTRERAEKELEDLNNDILKINSVIQEKRGVISRLQQETRLLRDKVNAVKSKLSSFTQGLGVALDNLEEATMKVEEEIRAIQQRELELRERLNALMTREKDLIAEENRLDAEIAMLERRLGEVESDYREKEGIVKKGICPVCGQKIPHEHGFRLLAELRERAEKIREELEEARRKRGIVREERSKLRSEIDRVQAELADLVGAKDRVREAEKLLLELKSLVERAAEVASNEEAIKRMQQEVESLEVSLREKKEKYASLKNELSRLREAEKAMSSRLSELEGELRTLNDQLQKIQVLEEKLKSLRSELNKLVNSREVVKKVADMVDEVSRVLAQETFRFVSESFTTIFTMLAPDKALSIELGRDYEIRFYYATEKGRGPVVLPSGGQQSVASLALRLAVNQALRAISPRLKDSTLLLDEPTIGLSRELVARLRELLNKLDEEQKAHIVVVTHDTDLLEAGSTRVRLVLRDGATQVSYEGELDESYRAFIESLLERPP